MAINIWFNIIVIIHNHIKSLIDWDSDQISIFLYRFTFNSVQVGFFENLAKFFIRKYFDKAIMKISISSKPIFYQWIDDILAIFKRLNNLKFDSKGEPFAQ